MCRYVTEVHIKNFQSHKNTIIPLTPGLNVIVGQSNHGKSAVFRALHWLYNNEFNGKADSFIRLNESKTSVKVLFNDGTSVEREKGRGDTGSVNSYTITHSDGSIQKFSSVSKDVPDEVRSILGSSNYVLPGDKKPNTLNFWPQGEPPYLLHESGPTRARILNSFTGIDRVDKAVKELASDNRNLARDEKNIIESIDKVTSRIAKYDNLDELQQIYDDMQVIVVEADEVQNKLDFLTSCKGRYQQALSDKKIVEDSTKRLKSIIEKSVNLDNVTTTINELAYLEKSKQLAKELHKKGIKLKEVYAKMPKIPSIDIPSIIELVHRYTLLLKYQKRVVELTTKSEYLSNKLKDSKKSLEDNINNYTSLLSEQKICPTCFREIDEEVIEKALHEC